MANKILLLVTVQDLSANDLACYGGVSGRTPVLDEMIVRGTVFDSHYSRCFFHRNDQCGGALKKKAHFDTDSSSSSPYETVFTKAKQNKVKTFHSSLGGLSEEASFAGELHKLKTDFEKTLPLTSSSFIWIELKSNDLSRLETILQTLQDLLENRDEDFEEVPEIHWLMTAERKCTVEQNDENSSEKQYSPLYSEAINNSMSFQLRRPLILVSQNNENGMAQRVSELTSAEEVGRAIELFFDSETKLELQPEADSLFSLSKVQRKNTSSENQLGIFQGINQTGLRTTTDLTVVPESIHKLEKTTLSNWPTARYYLKPEDQYDTNDLASSFPVVVDQRLETLQKILSGS